MHFSTAIISYLLTVIICLALPIYAIYRAKKQKKTLNVLHFLIGLLVFVAVFIGYILMLSTHLSVKDGVNNYFNTASYRVTVISLLTVVVSILLWLISMRAYVKRQARKECSSFYLGFGCSGCVIVGVYALCMFFVLLFHYLGSDLLFFDVNLGAFCFSPDTKISVFRPMFGHVSLALAALSVLFVSYCFSRVLNQIAITKVPLLSSTIAYVGMVASLCILIDVICFMNMFNIAHYVMAIFSVLCDVLAFGMVKLVEVYKEVKDEKYTKQFN